MKIGDDVDADVAAGGEAEAVGLDGGDRAVYERLYPMLRRYAAAVAPVEMDPDDLVQEALASVLAGGGFARIEHPGAYLRRSIVNLASNGRRSLARRRIALDRLRGSGEVETVPQYPSELAALLRLSPPDRALLYLADVEGRSFDEIGEILDMRTTTARGRASRARRLLRAQLESGKEDHGHP